MKLRRIYDHGTEPVDLSIEDLINEGAGGDDECRMELRVDMLTRILAHLLRRSMITPKELILLTGNEFRFEEAESGRQNENGQ